MSTPKSRRWLLLAIFLIGLPLIGFAAFQYAIHTLKTQVEKALGPQSEVREIKVGLNGVEILGLRIKAPPREEGGKKPLAWPASTSNSPPGRAARSTPGKVIRKSS